MRWAALQRLLVSSASLSVPRHRHGAPPITPGWATQPWSGVRVLGVGLERTGTESLTEALRVMGFNTSHGFEDVVQHQDSYNLWKCHGWEKKSAWLRARRYEALTDNPYRAYFWEIMAEYPDVKLVLTIHKDGPQGWANSTEKLLGHREDPAWYTTWNQRVIDTVPSGRLLVFNSSLGYKPLADFLGLPVPDGEYPYTSRAYGPVSHEVDNHRALLLHGCPDGQRIDTRWSDMTHFQSRFLY